MSSNATLSTPNNGAQIKASRTRGASHIVSCHQSHSAAKAIAANLASVLYRKAIRYGALAPFAEIVLVRLGTH